MLNKDMLDFKIVCIRSLFELALNGIPKEKDSISVITYKEQLTILQDSIIRILDAMSKEM